MALNVKKVKNKTKADEVLEQLDKENEQTNSAEVTIESLNKAELETEPVKEITKEAVKEKPKKTVKKDEIPKNKGGRPPLDTSERRKQYTLTLEPDTYQMIMKKAKEEKISFAKYVERATLEYIENHS